MFDRLQKRKLLCQMAITNKKQSSLHKTEVSIKDFFIFCVVLLLLENLRDSEPNEDN